MKNNKLISIVLALLVCLSLVVSVSAATENDLTFALESSDSNVEGLNLTAVKSGENVVVNLMIPNNSGIRYAKAIVTYESDVLELVDSTAVSGVQVAEKAGEIRVEIGDIMAAIDRNNNKAPFNATGAVVTLTFKALATDDVVSEIALAINGKDVIDANRETNTPSVNVAMNVNVVGKNHNHSAYGTVEADNAAEPTCTEAGKNADLICTHCGEIAKAGEEITALGHKEVVDAAVEATCKNSGLTEGKHCSVCNAVLVKQDVINALDHDFDVDPVVTKQPTCTAAGEQTYSCAYGCGETKVDNNVPAVGHKFGDWSVTKEATSDAEGEETRTCANCQEKEVRSIAKLPAKSNTGLIIGIVVVVVLAGAGVAAFFVLKNKKK